MKNGYSGEIAPIPTGSASALNNHVITGPYFNTFQALTEQETRYHQHLNNFETRLAMDVLWETMLLVERHMESVRLSFWFAYRRYPERVCLYMSGYDCCSYDSCPHLWGIV